MQLARARARTDSTTHAATTQDVGKYLRMRMGLVREICSMRRGFCTLVLFIIYLFPFIDCPSSCKELEEFAVTGITVEQ